jgi:hypothetical protein
MELGPLYHWSPADRREKIEAEGLRLYQPTVCHSLEDHLAPYLSLGTSPRGAWNLSGDTLDETGIDEWDLWEVYLGEKDSVRVRAEFGPLIREVKTLTPIPPDRLWLVGRRKMESFRVVR